MNVLKNVAHGKLLENFKFPERVDGLRGLTILVTKVEILIHFPLSS